MQTIWIYFLGFGFGVADKPHHGGGDDYLQPALVGFFELLIYPVLMAFKPEYIGAWLAFKVVPQLGTWSKRRATYQRFLLGNALVLAGAYWLMSNHIP